MASNAFVPQEPAVETAGPVSGLHLRQPNTGIFPRLVSLVMLIAVVAGFGYAGLTGYRLATDSFVAPIILSPDSDIVIQNKLSLSRILAERTAIELRIEDNNAGVEAAAQAIEQLKDLKRASTRALDWSTATSARQASAGETDLEALSKKERVLADMIERQEQYARDMQNDLDAGLVHKSEVARQENALSELRVAALQNERDRLAAEVQIHTALLTGQALKNSNASTGLSTPEMLLQKDQLVRIELEILRLDAERRAKAAQRRADDQELAELDDLLSQMKSRPVFRAIHSSQNAAFVPYTQINGVRPGLTVYDCAIWGIFSCSPVGTVSEVLPGEVATQDPWGAPTRGQYAILELFNPVAAQSKALRVRDEGKGFSAALAISRR